MKRIVFEGTKEQADIFETECGRLRVRTQREGNLVRTKMQTDKNLIESLENLKEAILNPQEDDDGQEG